MTSFTEETGLDEILRGNRRICSSRFSYPEGRIKKLTGSGEMLGGMIRKTLKRKDLPAKLYNSDETETPSGLNSGKAAKRRRMLKKWYILLGVLLVGLLFGYYENHHLEVTEYRVPDSRIPQEFDGFRVVQLSDLHNQRFGWENRKLIEKVTELSPDIIVFTGDIVDANHTNPDAAIDLCRELAGFCPVYYVTGNHEYWLTEEERKELMEGLSGAGVRILDNCFEKISSGADSLTLIGLDDKALFGNTLKNLTKEVPEAFHLVLAHEPQYLAEYERNGADLVLSGHAHGGQFILPFVGPVVAPDQGFFPELTSGLHQSGDTQMIISRGLGNSVIPIRLFNDPEIVLVVLQEEKSL